MENKSNIEGALNGEDFTANDKSCIILYFQGVTIHNFVINENVNRSVIENYNTSDAEAVTQREETEGEIPEALRTEEATTLLQKAVETGWLDEQWQPMVSSKEAALLAMFLAEKLQIANQWKVFGTLWNRNSETLRANYNEGMNQKQTMNFMERVKKSLK